jgi:hypothetical protein
MGASPGEETVSREEIIIAMKECAAKLGRPPGADEFRLTMSVRRHLIRKHFSTYTQLLTECGLERHGSGKALTLESMFKDWRVWCGALAKFQPQRIMTGMGCTVTVLL